MVKNRQDWIETDVRPYQDKSVPWLSQYHFFIDPIIKVMEKMELR